ncbi:hypothetical protein ACFL4H_01940 [Candidatus Neomarinimicrobiota bacterium]
MSEKMKQVFSAVAAIVVLVIYVLYSYKAIKYANCVALSECTKYPADYFTDNMAGLLAGISSLVAAVVVAAGISTNPGEKLGVRLIPHDATKESKTIVSYIMFLYLVVWFITGIMYLNVSLRYPEAVPVLTTLGKSWIGLLISVAGAYLGVKVK